MITVLKNELSTVHAQKDKLHDLLEQGIYDTDTFMERSKVLDEKAKGISESIKQVEKKSHINIFNLEETKQKIINFISLYDKLSDEKRNNLMKEFITAIYYYKEPDWKKSMVDLEVIYKNI
jgi:hypothetical protein